jgi:hypothetical protein
VIFNAVKFYDMGPMALLLPPPPPPKEGVLRIFIALNYPSLWFGLNKHANHYMTDATI